MSKLRAPQIDTGTGANQIVELDASSRLPAVDGSQLTSVDADTLGGQPTGTGANDIVALDASSRLPAVDGSQLTSVDTGLLLASKTSDEAVTNSIVFQSDDELFVTIPGPGFYIINLFVVSDGPSAGLSLDFKFNYADTISSSVLSLSSDPSAGGLTIDVTSYSIATGGVGFFDGSMWIGSATFLNSGLLELQWAQQVAKATATTLFAGSYLSLQKV